MKTQAGNAGCLHNVKTPCPANALIHINELGECDFRLLPALIWTFIYLSKAHQASLHGAEVENETFPLMGCFARQDSNSEPQMNAVNFPLTRVDIA